MDYHCRAMEEAFILSLTYKEQLCKLSAKFFRVGYIHQFHVEIGGRTLIFELDEERQYRVIDTNPDSKNEIEPGLIEATIHKLSSLN